MSFITKESRTGQTTLGGIMVLPSKAQWSDIEEIQQCNRGANEPKENLDELMKSIKARGVVTPLKGYLDNKHLFITAGSRRLAASHALEAEGEVFPLPVILINKPETAEDIAAAILDSAVDNNFRNDDSAVVLHKSFEVLRNLEMSYKDIGDATGFSHQKVYNLLKAFEVKPLKEAIIKGEISDRAASEYFTETYLRKGKDGKPVTKVEEQNGKKVRVKVYDEEKIGNALKAAKTAANASGKGKIGTTTAKKTQSDKTPAPGMRAVRIILDEPEDNVPSLFRNYNKWLNGGLTDEQFKKIAKSNKYWDEISWLFDIEFDADKIKAKKDAEKAAKDKQKAAKAAKAKKDNPAVEEEEEVLDAEEYE